MRRGLLACVASLALVPATAGTAMAQDPAGTQAVGQGAASQQSATSSATSTQVAPSNTNTSVRIFSPGNDGSTTQANSSAATSAAGNLNGTAQQALQAAGGAGTQAIGQAAASQQSADSSATSTQVAPSNTNTSVRIASPGDAGSVQQANQSAATSAAGNADGTAQQATQAGGGGGTQAVGQDAANKQDASSDATSTQVKPSNTNTSVRIFSPGNDGKVKQVNDSSATSAAGNANITGQTANQTGGGSGGGTQAVGQDAKSDQDATSHATSEQIKPSNTNTPVRIFSPGHDDDVTQANSSSATSAAGNVNLTGQAADQTAGGGPGYVGGAPVQAIGQGAESKQDATSSATSKQVDASNVNTPVRIDSPGGGGSVTQANVSAAASAAGNLNLTGQSADQVAGGGLGGSPVQAIGQLAFNDQDAMSQAASTQIGATNVNAPVRVFSPGGGGDVLQANPSSAISAAGNANLLGQDAEQTAGGGGSPIQAVGQLAGNVQSAQSSAASDQLFATNLNVPVRVFSPGGGGSVGQFNVSSAFSAAGNLNAALQRVLQVT